jgi:hypothetical protein
MLVPSIERELTGGLQMVMTATPSAPTSISVLPFAAIAPLVAEISPRLPNVDIASLQVSLRLLGVGRLQDLSIYYPPEFIASTV